MSGGEALLNPNFFRFCELLQKQNIGVSLLSTGLTLQKNAGQLVQWVNDIIVSLDGNEELHNAIRNIPDAFKKLKEGVREVKSKIPTGMTFKITGRTVIHRLNFRHWVSIIESAKEIGLDQVSFLPADVSSHAFNREMLWSEERQHEIILDQKDLPELNQVIEGIIKDFEPMISSGFIAESP